MNAFDAIVAGALQALRLYPAVTDGLIDEDIDVGALDETVTEVVSVSVVSSDPQNRAAILGHPVDWISVLQVETYARSDSPSSTAGRASRALQARVYTRLMSSPTLGGVAADVLAPTFTTELRVLNTRMGCTTGSYPVLHRTQGNSLDAPA